MRHAVDAIAQRSLTAHALALCGLMLAAFLTVRRSFFEFGFYYDDWRYVQQVQQGGSVLLQFPSRPLHQPLTDLVFRFIGLHPSTGYLMLSSVLAISALAMYWVVIRLFPRRRGFAVLASALFILYPGDLSRTWLSAALTSNRPAVVLALISLGLLFTAARQHHRRRWLAIVLAGMSLTVYTVSLMLYEAQALLVPGLGFAGLVWIGWYSRGLSHRRAGRKVLERSAIYTVPYLVVFAGVLTWRLLFLDSSIEDGYVANTDFSAGYIARQLGGVYYFNFVEQPVAVISAAVPFLFRFGVTNIGLTVVTAALLTALVLIFGFRIPRYSGELAVRARISGDLRFYRNVIAAGLLLTGLVYAVMLPHDHIISAGGLEGPFASRLNTSAAVVVAITAAAGVMLLWTWARRRFEESQRRVNLSAASAVAVVLTLLVIYHGIVQADYAEAWGLQQRYTRDIVESLPSVEPGTHIVISGVPTEHRSSYVFMLSTEHMLRLVYGDPTVSATALNDGFNGWTLNADGLYRAEQLIAPAGTIVFLQLDTAGCPAKAPPGCGKLVLAETLGPGLIASGRFGPNAGLVTTNFSRIHRDGRLTSSVDGLLGLPPVSAIVAAPADEPGPIFASPSDPPSE